MESVKACCGRSLEMRRVAEVYSAPSACSQTPRREREERLPGADDGAGGAQKVTW